MEKYNGIYNGKNLDAQNKLNWVVGGGGNKVWFHRGGPKYLCINMKSFYINIT